MERTEFRSNRRVMDRLVVSVDLVKAYLAIWMEGFRNDISPRIDAWANMSNHIEQCRRCQTIQHLERSLDSTDEHDYIWNSYALRAIKRHLPQ